MNPNENVFVPLMTAMLDGHISDADQERLADLLRDDAAAQEKYIDLCWTHALLRQELGAYADVPNTSNLLPVDSQRIGESLPIVFVDSTAGPAASPFSLSSAFGSAVFSYGVSAIIVAAMLICAWAYKISLNQQFNGQVAGVNSPDNYAGRITGMKDCRWTDPNQAPYAGSFIRPGRRFDLNAGLLEITYTSGAKVILEGPCVYEIDSDASGRLQLGKLVARVEKNDELGIRNKESERWHPDIHHSSFITHNLFSVRTPTAVVTDLGTEFGVEVDGEGNTASCVFEGTVRVEVVNGGSKQGIVLHEGDAVRVVTDKPAALKRLATGEAAGEMPIFVRRLATPPAPKPIDLLDIIAGGNGLGHQRESGIDPSTGMEDSMFQIDYRENGRRFIPIVWNELIDGVFMPDGRDGSVQVDSAGHKFDGFPMTDGRQFGSIWSRTADVGQVRGKITRSWVYSMVNGAQFMPERRGLLVFYANTGITFNLEALRKKHSNIQFTRFKAVAGLADGSHSNPEDFGQVDLWVLVNGQLKFKREKLRVRDGVVKMDVELAPNDRFLTLAVGDGGNGIGLDCMVFGDPVLQTNSTENRKEERAIQ